MPKILVIDDQDPNLKVLSATLSSYLLESTVYTALGGPEGLERAIELNESIDLIITDVRMPDVDGFELCQRLKEKENAGELRPVPILILSAAFTDSEHRVRGLRYGADGYLSRPYSNDELIAQVQVLLRIKASEDELRKHEQELESILERRNHELVQSQKNFSAIFDCSPDAIYVVSTAGLVIGANPAACTLHGYTVAEFLDRPFRDFFTIHGQQVLEMELDALFAGDRHSLICGATTSEGRVRELELRAQSIVYDQEPAKIFMARDVSERVAQEDQLRASQKMDAVGRLAGGIAHDFNNLLTSILGYAQLIAEVGKDNSQISDDILQVIHSAERASDLTRQLLVFGRRQTFPSHPVDVNQVVSGTDQLLRRALGEDIELVTLLGEKLGYVRSDEGHIEQIVLNLAINAREAMPNGGKVVIKTDMSTFTEDNAPVAFEAPAGTYIHITVSDDGEGINQENQDKIFDPYFTTKKASAATGLGLSTVYGIVRQAGGFVQVSSELGTGSAFHIYLPETQIEADIPRPISTHDEVLPSGDETILVVEDEELVRQLCVRILKGLGYHVLEARNGSEGLRVAREYAETIHLLLTDVVMPVMGGPELYDSLHDERPDMKVLYVSGFSDNRLDNSVKEAESHALLLRKPYTRKQIATFVRALLDRENKPSA